MEAIQGALLPAGIPDPVAGPAGTGDPRPATGGAAKDHVWHWGLWEGSDPATLHHPPFKAPCQSPFLEQP
jgi:hypothetical protein